MNRPLIGTRWVHTNNHHAYTILLLTNEHSENDNYQIQVVYKGDNGKIWSKPLSDWHRSMTLENSSLSFEKQYLGDFQVTEREIKLHEKLEDYYSRTGNEVSNKNAMVIWKEFKTWADNHNYSSKEINIARCNVSKNY
jgi:hypothetical protein